MESISHAARVAATSGDALQQNTTVRRVARIAWLFATLIFAYFVFQLFTLDFKYRLATVRSFNPDGFTVQLSSCDATVFVDKKASFKVEGLLTKVQEDLDYLRGGSFVKYLKVTNRRGCLNQPNMDCHRVCHVKIGIPAGKAPSVLWFYQDPKDTADHVRVKVEPGVQLKTLRVRGSAGRWNSKAGRTIEVDVNEAEITGALEASLEKGHCLVRKTTLGGAVDVRSSGSVMFLDVKKDGKTRVLWRQPNNHVCFQGLRGQLPLPDPAGKLALCDSPWYFRRFTEAYDTGKDFFMDIDEVKTVFDKVGYCCGGFCPQWSSCHETTLQAVFPMVDSGDSGPAGRSGILTTGAAWGNVKDLGLAGIAPHCIRELQFTTPATSSREVMGWPLALPGVANATVEAPSIDKPCLRDSDCFTGYCGNDTGTPTCAANPAVTYTPQFFWSTCDKACGGGQKVRSSVCVGSDGRQYPDELCSGASGVAPLVASCNTQACVLPTKKPNFTITADEDLLADRLGVIATLSIPGDADGVSVHLGSADYIEAGAVATIEPTEDCEPETSCTLEVAASLPRWADRLYARGYTKDGGGPAISASFVDRVGTSYDSMFRLQSEAGAVQLKLRASTTTEDASQERSTWSPEDKLSGVRMFYFDAKTLQQDVARKYGDPQSSMHGMIIIDTVASTRTPATRWIYTTRPVYLAMDPAHLTFFTGGLLTPPLLNYRVSFTDHDCSEEIGDVTEDWDFGAEATKVALGQVWDQIQRSMRSNGRAVNQKLRGELLLLAPEFKLKPEARKMYYFEKSDEGDKIEMYLMETMRMDFIMDVAWALSALAGLLIGGAFAYLLFKLAKRELQNWEREVSMRHTVLANRLGTKSVAKKTDANIFMKSNPFKEPFLLIGVFVIMPLRRKLTNSLERFMKAHCKIHPRHVRKSAAEPESDAEEPASSKAKEKDIESGNMKVASLDAGVPQLPGVVMVEPAKGEEQAQKEAEESGLRSTASESSITQSKQVHHYVYMRDFRKRYEEFCIDEGLNPVTSRAKIVQHLVRSRNLRTNQETVCRIKGVKWYGLACVPDGDEMYARGADVDCPTSSMEAAKSPLLSNKEAAAPDTVPMRLIRAEGSLGDFIEEKVEVTRNFHSDYLELQTRQYPNGLTMEGLSQRYYEYCLAERKEALPPVELRPFTKGGALVEWADRNHLAYQEVVLQRINDISFSENAQTVFSGTSMFVDVIQVMLHIICLFLPAMVLIMYSLSAQEVYSKTMATEDPVTWYDVLGNWYPWVDVLSGGKQTMPLVTVITVSQLAYMTFALFRMVLHYVGVKHRFIEWYNSFFGLLLLIEVAGCSWWVGVVCAWCVLAAILEPVKFLSYGAAVLVLIFVAITVWNQMFETAKTMRGKVQKEAQDRMQGVLQGIKQQTERRAHEKAVTQLGLRERTATAEKFERKVDSSLDGFKQYHQDARKKRQVTLTDIFNLLDEDRSGDLSLDEFRTLFSTADGGGMSDDQIEQLFAYCDADGSGSVSAADLEEGWSFVVSRLVEKEMRNLGISNADIVVMVSFTVALLTVLFLFIFLALQGWYEENSFGSLVQTGLVSGSGKAVLFFRRRAPGERASMKSINREFHEAQEDEYLEDDL
eukprot:TRINITY_DN26654_c0_g2_i1.p1 TRINITY_DN26654_c0_g2~~TRINITY_DN26654_c0_g2_i1.p1  ORF type:complete len:1617 (+),score=442.53 TRINITY_DN26654_c0_g2_i1:183-5033(+)